MVESVANPYPSRRKRLAFRLAAVLVGLIPLLAAELVLRSCGIGYLSEQDDPYIGFSETHPLFVQENGYYVTSPSRLAYFRPDRFRIEKPPREFRIFCLGGSTVQGRPYAIETSFTAWLQLSLQAADSRHDWRVVNCGGVSYASYRLTPILEEVMNYAPDLVIVYSGHNEFLESRTYADLHQQPAWRTTFNSWSGRSNLYNTLRTQWHRLQSEGTARRTATPLSGEVDALLDYEGGLDDYHRDDTWRKGAVEHYGWNLKHMSQVARRNGVPLLFVDPACNLGDCPPFKAEPDSDLSDIERETFADVWQAIRDEEDPARRHSLLEQAVTLAPRHAGAHYALGKSCQAAGRLTEARTALIRAKEEDLCPLRMIEPLHESLRAVASSENRALVEVRAVFEAKSRGEIPDERWFLDHVHPSINGHQLIAEELVEAIIRAGFAQREAGWQERQKANFAQHLASLDDAYFVHGQQRLRGLIFWTKGQASKKRPEQ